ncbi:MAG: hypothetical protein J7578_17100 [Chitinophagaceae bacterium]|nr:hypothetical protein [Chitinophagaceae bacterium]
MKKYTVLVLLFFIVCIVQAQRNDNELNRDSVLDWRYITTLAKAQPYKPVKDNEVPGSNYSVWQQQATDILFKWVQQSVLPRGLVMRNLLRENQQWWLNGAPALHSYGIQLAGFPAHFVNGKLNLQCCEIGQYLSLGFNSFPGDYLRGGFNPDGLYFFAELPSFSTGDTDDKLRTEGVDKQILPQLHAYRTYLDHFHDSGKPWNRIGVVVAKNGEWPFKPVLIKDLAAYIDRQLTAFPGIEKKNPSEVKAAREALTRLKPFYNEVVKLKETNFNNAMLKDEDGHAIVNPGIIINGMQANKTFPEYRILVATTQSTIDQSRSDKPLWLYLNFSGNGTAVANPTQFDPLFSTERDFLVNTLLRNFNFDYASKWMSQPETMKSVVYNPVNAPARSSGNTITTPVATSPSVAAKNKDPFTILYEDFNGYATGTFSVKGWHTYGHDGHSFENAILNSVTGQSGKWITIPDAFTFYPDFSRPLPASFTVNYDVCFGSNISNKRTPIFFRLDTKDPNPKKSNPIDLHDINRSGFQFSIALSGESETGKRFMDIADKETTTASRITGLKANDIVQISIAVNGASVAVAVNGKEVMHDNNALPAGKTFKRYGWYSGDPAIYLSNIVIKSGTPVQPATQQAPLFTGIVKDPEPTAAKAFDESPYIFTPLAKSDAMTPVNYPANFRSTLPALPTSSKKVSAGLKMNYGFPVRSAALMSLSNTIVSANGFKKLIDSIQFLASNKLQASNTGKIDNYLKAKKVTGSTAIGNLAINAWIESRPTAAIYLFCKALQPDYTDMLTANNLASILITYGYAEKAIPVLLYIAKQTNGAPEALSNLANAWYNLGDLNTAMEYAGQCIAKDSLNSIANKVAAFAHLNKAAQSNNIAETEKAIVCLKQSLKSGYDKEASDILNKIEPDHKQSDDFANTNHKEFPMLKRLEIPAMPEDLHQMRSFDRQIEMEKTSLSKTTEEVFAAYKKIPAPNYKQTLASATQSPGIVLMMAKASAIISRSGQWYMKMKKDLEDIFLLNKKVLTDKHNEKMKAISKKYLALLNKLEGGEGKSDEEDKIEQLKAQRCEEENKELAAWLSDISKITNTFAQQSEYVSRIFCRDMANWGPLQQYDNSDRPFLEAQRIYLGDVYKILTFYTAIEPCIYPSRKIENNNDQKGPKEWEGQYCANFKGTAGLGLCKISFNCNSMSIAGGEGFVGELTLNYNEDGRFKDVTIGAGAGVEAHWGNKQIASLSASASVTEYITIGAGANGSISITDWGTAAGVGAGANIAEMVGGEANIFSGKLSAQSGVTAEGAIPDALKILLPDKGK